MNYLLQAILFYQHSWGVFIEVSLILCRNRISFIRSLFTDLSTFRLLLLALKKSDYDLSNIIEKLEKNCLPKRPARAACLTVLLKKQPEIVKKNKVPSGAQMHTCLLDLRLDLGCIGLT